MPESNLIPDGEQPLSDIRLCPICGRSICAGYVKTGTKLRLKRTGRVVIAKRVTAIVFPYLQDWECMTEDGKLRTYHLRDLKSFDHDDLINCENVALSNHESIQVGTIKGTEGAKEIYEVGAGATGVPRSFRGDI